MKTLAVSSCDAWASQRRRFPLENDPRCSECSHVFKGMFPEDEGGKVKSPSLYANFSGAIGLPTAFVSRPSGYARIYAAVTRYISIRAGFETVPVSHCQLARKISLRSHQSSPFSLRARLRSGWWQRRSVSILKRKHVVIVSRDCFQTSRSVLVQLQLPVPFATRRKCRGRIVISRRDRLESRSVPKLPRRRIRDTW